MKFWSYLMTKPEGEVVTEPTTDTPKATSKSEAVKTAVADIAILGPHDANMARAIGREVAIAMGAEMRAILAERDAASQPTAEPAT